MPEQAIMVRELSLPGDGLAYWLEGPDAARGSVLLFHGYGQSRAEGLGVATPLALAGFSVLVPDLPGHGSHPGSLGPEQAIAFVHRCFERLPKEAPIHAVGFSLGARLAMVLPVTRIVAVSPPGRPDFEGSRLELLRDLRARNVREPAPFSGLEEVLSALGDKVPSVPMRLISGQRDLKSVRDFAGLAKEADRHVIRHADHHGAWTSPRTLPLIKDWLLGGSQDAG